MIQSRIFQLQRRLNITAGLLLAEDVGDIVGAESAGGMRFFKGGGHGIGAIVADESEQLAHLPG